MSPSGDTVLIHAKLIPARNLIDLTVRTGSPQLSSALSTFAAKAIAMP